MGPDEEPFEGITERDDLEGSKAAGGGEEEILVELEPVPSDERHGGTGGRPARGSRERRGGGGDSAGRRKRRPGPRARRSAGAAAWAAAFGFIGAAVAGVVAVYLALLEGQGAQAIAEARWTLFLGMVAVIFLALFSALAALTARARAVGWRAA